MTFDTASVRYFDDFTDPATPFVWLNLDLENGTGSYSLVLQLTLPTDTEMPDIIGKPQAMVFSEDAEAFAVRPGYTEGDILYESYLIGISEETGITLNPVVDGEGVVAINTWNGYDFDEMCSLDLDVTVTTDLGETLHFNYQGAVTMDFFDRVRSRSKNPAYSDSNLFFRNLDKCSGTPATVGADGANVNIIELSNDEFTSGMNICFVMPDDSTLVDMNDVSFTVSDAGTPLTVCPGVMKGTDVDGTVILLNGSKHPVKNGTVTVHRYGPDTMEKDFWDYINMVGVFTDEDGTTYNWAYITKP